MGITLAQRLRRHIRLSGVVAAGLVAALALASCGSKTGSDDASGGEAGGWKPTKDISWIVPYGPGGGFDVYARGVADALQRTQLPKGVNAVIRNMPPLPQGITAMYTAKPDGYTIGILPMPAAIAEQIQDPDLAKWDTEKFTVLGSVDENAYVVYVAADSPYRSIEDLKNKPDLRSLTVEEGSSSALAGLATIKALGLDAKVTYGADGSADVVTGLLRGDADFIVYGSTDLTGFVESGDIRPVMFLGTEDGPRRRSVPSSRVTGRRPPR
jgi:putative tricarboxylic transport membrane protein